MTAQEFVDTFVKEVKADTIVVGFDYSLGLDRKSAEDLKEIFDGEEERFEVNIFDFDEDIYGDRVTVYWLDRIRDMVKFESVEELVHQLEDDEKIARK